MAYKDIRYFKFTIPEIKYLLELTLDNLEKGIYWGRKDYFMKRQNKVIQQLNDSIKGSL